MQRASKSDVSVGGWWFERHRDGQLRAVNWEGVLGQSPGLDQPNSGHGGPRNLNPQDSAVPGDTDQRSGDHAESEYVCN